MQTIARANRVNEGKSNGLIVDYIGIVKALRKALADYTANNSGTGTMDPTVDKDVLISRIVETIGKIDEYFKGRDFYLGYLINADGFKKLSFIQDAANIVCDSEEDKRMFNTYAVEIHRLMKYINRDDIDKNLRKQYEAILAIYSEIKKTRKSVDNTDLMIEINKIISDYVEIEHIPYVAREETKRLNIGTIDFDFLRREFAKNKRKNLILRDLEELIQKKLGSMLYNNPDRINYYERYKQIISDYNNELDRATIEKTFMGLLALAN